MNNFLETLASYTTANIAALDAIVADRIYPVEAPQGVALPFGVFTQVSASENIHHGGKCGWGSMRIQYDFYAKLFHDCYDAARVLRSEFEGKSTQIAVGTLICYCEVETEFDEFDSKEEIYRRSLDLLFEYKITT